ncbi:DUF6069 family protein [Actinomadura sp. 9N407]|uniref:DUF6069 family protein n=1 Tax=Actinomadura sp. 9N407 TaxID=3375154 RepID=UPI0037AF9D4A
MVVGVQENSGAGVRLRGRAIAVGVAVLAAVVLWLIAVPVIGQELAVTYPEREPMTVGFGPVVVFAAGSSLAGWGLLALLELVTRARARIVWTVIAAIVLVLSFSPLLQIEAAGSTKATLALLHLVVGVPLIFGFWRTR